MYSTLTVSTFVTAWITGDFIYTMLVPIVITAVAYYVYDYFIENGMKKGRKKRSTTTIADQTI